MLKLFKGKQGNKGFTLVEIVLAVALLAGAAIAIGAIIIGTKNSSEKLFNENEIQQQSVEVQESLHNQFLGTNSGAKFWVDNDGSGLQLVTKELDENTNQTIKILALYDVDRSNYKLLKTYYKYEAASKTLYKGSAVETLDATKEYQYAYTPDVDINTTLSNIENWTVVAADVTLFTFDTSGFEEKSLVTLMVRISNQDITASTNDTVYARNDISINSDLLIEPAQSIKVMAPSITTQNFIYNGTEQAPVESNFNDKYVRRKTSSVMKATDAGKYTITYQLIDGNATWQNGMTEDIVYTWEIKPKEITVAWGTTHWPDDGAEHSTTCEITNGLINGDTKDSIGFYLADNLIGPEHKNQLVTISMTSPNYFVREEDVARDITMGDRVAEFIELPKAADLTYNGTSQQLLASPGSTENGTIVYALSMNGTYSESIPTATEAAQYTIYYKILPNDGYFGTSPRKLSITIKKAGMPDTPKPIVSEIIYDGKPHQLVTAPESPEGCGPMVFSRYPDGPFSPTPPTGTDAKTYTIYYRLNPGEAYDASNVEEIEVSIEKVQAEYVWPTAVEKLVYNGNDQMLITGGKVKGGVMKYKVLSRNTGVMTKETSSIENAVGHDAGEYVVICKVEGDANHGDSEEHEIVVKIAKSSNAVTSLPQSEVSYCPEAPSLKLLVSTTGDGEITATSSNQSIAAVSISGKTLVITPGTKSGNAVITVTTNDGNNYYASSTTMTITTEHKKGTEYVRDKNPTCTEDGSESVQCLKCGIKYESRSIKKLGHSPIKGGTLEVHEQCERCNITLKGATAHNYKQDEAVAPTCMKMGGTKYTCDCGYYYVKEDIPKIDHIYKDYTIDVQPKCTTNGSKSKHCTMCGRKTDITSIKAPGHSWTDYELNEANLCTLPGNKTRYCTVCKVEESVIIPALGDHIWNSSRTVDKVATCTVDGVSSIHCTRCPATKDVKTTKAPGHKYSAYTITKQPKCNVHGEQYRECSVCKNREIEVIPAPGHKTIFVGTKDVHSKCSVCNTVLQTKHYYATRVASTVSCVTNGSLEKTCECGYSYTTITEPAWGHKPISAENGIKATCTTDGKTSDTLCTVCKQIIKKGDVIKATGHKAVSANNGVPATCTTDGRTSDTKCSDCGYVISKGTVITKTGHNKVNANNATAATCTTSGHKTDYICSKCNLVMVPGEVIPALGHKEKTTAAVAPTCTSDGSTIKIICERCNVIITPSTVVPKLGHQWTITNPKVNPTCEANGKEADEKCSRCGTVTTGAVIAKLGHQYDKIVANAVASTCTTSGKTAIKECIRCSSRIGGDTVDILPHNFEKIEAIAVTCTTDGFAEGKKCKTCGHAETGAVIKALGHDWSKTSSRVRVAPTCTADGSNWYDCKRCGATGQVNYYTTSKLGHSWNKASTRIRTNQSCTVDETRYYDCSRCGSTGNTTHWYTNKTKLGHNYATATCTAPQTCTRCKVTNGSALGHDWTKTSSRVRVAPTCTADGSNWYDCKRCGTTGQVSYYTTSKLGHSWATTYTVDTAATCTTTGVKTKHCTRSGCKATTAAQTIAALGHSWTKTSTRIRTSQSCTVDETRYYDCSRCGSTSNTSSWYATTGKRALGHNYNAYSSNTTQHWKACTRGCGATTLLGNHADTGTDGKCDTCGKAGTIVYTHHHHTGNSTSGGGCYSKPIPHVHTGTPNLTYANGCYTKASNKQVFCGYGTDRVEGPCSWWWDSANNRCVRCHSTDPNNKHYKTTCDTCGASCGDKHYVTKTIYVLNCSKSYDGYSLGCGMTTSTVISQKTVFQ